MSDADGLRMVLEGLVKTRFGPDLEVRIRAEKGPFPGWARTASPGGWGLLMNVPDGARLCIQGLAPPGPWKSPKTPKMARPRGNLGKPLPGPQNPLFDPF